MNKIRTFLPLLAAVSVCGCDSCSKPKAGPADAAASASAPAETSSVAPPAPPIRQLTDRTPLDGKALLAARADELKSIEAAGKATKPEDAKSALADVLAARSKDLTGGFLALETSRTALKAGDADQALKSALLATRFAAGSPKLYKAAVDALKAAAAKKGVEATPLATAEGVPAIQASAMGPMPAIAAICDAVIKKVRAGEVQLLAATADPALPVTCDQDYALELGNADLRRAVSLKVDVTPKEPAGAKERLVWVTIETPKGVIGWGPVADVVMPAAGVENDVVADLQHVDVLPGGAPELVVKVMDRRTETDVALNEVAKLELAWVVMLTQDRGKLEVSKQIVLESKVVREAIDPADKKQPAGAIRAVLGKPVDYAMKVSWSGANSITLTKAQGSGTPFAEGEIRLFPE
jgi:hypothetical protein